MRPRCPRRGWSLVEMIAIMTMVAVIGSLLVPTLFRGFASYRNLRNEVEWIESTSRLGSMLRRDIRHAMQAEVKRAGESEMLELTSDDKTVTYSFTNSELVRDVANGRAQRVREGFPMPQEAQLAWEIEQKLVPIVSLKLDLPGPHQNSKRRDVVLRAYLGRNAEKGLSVP